MQFRSDITRFLSLFFGRTIFLLSVNRHLHRKEKKKGACSSHRVSVDKRQDVSKAVRL